MIVQSTHHPVLILETTKRTCHLPRNICDNITAVTKKIVVMIVLLLQFIINLQEKLLFRYLHFENSHVFQFLKTLIVVFKTAV